MGAEFYGSCTGAGHARYADVTFFYSNPRHPAEAGDASAADTVDGSIWLGSSHELT